MLTKLLLGIYLLSLLGIALPTEAQTYPPAWKSSASYAVGDQVQLNGNVVRAVHAVAPGGFKYADWELWECRANSTYLVGVGETFTNLQSAWTFIHNARVADGVSLRLYISSIHGSLQESFSSNFSLDHAFGARISVVGDSASMDIFIFQNCDGFTLDSGHTFGALSGVSIEGISSGPSYAGVTVSQNACLASAQGLSFEGFFEGFYVDTGASITGSGNTVVGASDGILADRGGNAALESCTFTNCSVGITAEEGAVADVSSGVFTGCTDGVSALYRAYVNVSSSSLSSTSEDIVCTHGAFVLALSDANNIKVVTGSGDGSFVFTG